MNKILILSLVVLIISCGSKNQFAHKNMNKENLHKLKECAELGDNDTLWLTGNTACVHTDGRYVKVGSVKKGKETGKWYHYYISKEYPLNIDSLDCYFIEKFRRKDTVMVYGVSVNRNDW
jgi:hypothetical protein